MRKNAKKKNHFIRSLHQFVPDWYFVYYEVIKREVKRRPIYECRCDERLNATVEGSTRLTYTGLFVVYYEDIKRDLGRPMYIYTRVSGEGRCDEILKPKVVVYYESIKRELQTRPIYECRCDERLKPKGEESTHLAYSRPVVYYETMKRKLI